MCPFCSDHGQGTYVPLQLKHQMQGAGGKVAFYAFILLGLFMKFRLFVNRSDSWGPAEKSAKPWGKKLPGKFSDGQKSFVYGRAAEFGVDTIKLEFGFNQDERSSDRTTRRELLRGGRRCVGWTID